MREGVKHDQDKLPMHLLPPELLRGVAAVLAFGADKYTERNWELGMAWHRPYAALLRHMLAWWEGEDLDPETGMSHLWHAACCIAFLMAYEARGSGTDDRPKGGQSNASTKDQKPNRPYRRPAYIPPEAIGPGAG